MDHDVVALACQLARCGHVLPAQGHRAAGHGFAGQHFAVAVHHTGRVGTLAARQHGAGVDHDALEVVVIGQSQVQHRQAGLRRNRHRHLIRHDEVVRAAEFLLGQKPAGQCTQLLLIGSGALGQKGVVRQRALPQGVGNRVVAS